MNDIALDMPMCSAQPAQPYTAVLRVFRHLELVGYLVGVEPESSTAAGLDDCVPLTPPHAIQSGFIYGSIADSKTTERKGFK